MVCEKCEKKGKLGKVITPDPWKAGASNTTKPGGRKVAENKLLTASKNRFNPMTTEFKKCRICKQKVHQVGSQERYLCHEWGEGSQDPGKQAVLGIEFHKGAIGPLTSHEFT